MDQRFRTAYERAASGMSWAEVAEGIPFADEDKARMLAHIFSDETGLPWPPEPIMEETLVEDRVEPATVRASRQTLGASKGQTAFELKVSHPEMTWAEVAAAVGMASAESARSAAKYYAERNSLEFPTYDPDKRSSMPKKAYELKVSHPEMTWAEIALKLGYARLDTARATAKRYADRHDLELPETRGELRGHFKDISRHKRAYELITTSPDVSWGEIASELGYLTATGARSAAQCYAERNGLDLPKTGVRTSIENISLEEAVYNLKVANRDMSWQDIAKKADTSHAKRAYDNYVQRISKPAEFEIVKETMYIGPGMLTLVREQDGVVIWPWNGAEGANRVTSVVFRMGTCAGEDISDLMLGLPSVTSVDISRLNLFPVRWATDVFAGCRLLAEVKGDVDVPLAEDVSGMFQDCSALEASPRISAPAAIYASELFSGCSALRDVAPIDISGAEEVSGMLYGCPKVNDLQINTKPGVWDLATVFGDPDHDAASHNDDNNR